MRRSRALVSLTFLALALVGSPASPSAQRRAAPTAKATMDARAKAKAGARPARQTAARTTADAVRIKADGLARTIRERGRADHEVKRYMAKGLKQDAQTAFDTLARLQDGGAIDAVTEHRAVAAVGRMLYAAHEIDPALVDAELRDTYDTLMSRAEFRRKSPNHQTAVEIETRMTDKILDAITTRDGTVGAVLREGGKRPPAFLAGKARGGDVESIPWDSLSRQEKIDVLRSQSKGRQFFDSRLIPGVKFRREISKPRLARVELGGKTAGPGKGTVSVDGVLMEKVEYMGPKAVAEVSGVEFHVRQPGKASRNAKDAFTLVDLVDSPARAGHQHMPVRIPSRVMAGDKVERAMLVDFYLRVNMVGELESVIDGYALSPVKDGSVIYFDFLQADGLAAMNQHLDSMARTGRPMLSNSSLKMGAVGFRTGELYGDDRMLGFEVRTLSKKRVNGGDKFVDAVQKGLLSGKYGLKRSAFQGWHDAAVGEGGVRAQGNALSRLHYNRPVRELIESAPDDVKAALRGGAGNRIRAEGEKAYGLKMLVHDWSADPALAGDTAGQKRIRTAQIKALGRLAAGGDAHQVTLEFVKGSGLYDTFAKSIGMDDPALER